MWRKHRKSGEVWLFCYRQRRQADGKWVEATPIRVGSLKEFPSEETAWRRVEELRLNPNQSTFGVSPQSTFGQLVAHYMQHELQENPRHQASRGQHASCRLLARGCQEGGSRGPAAYFRIPHVSQDASLGLGQDEGRSEVGAGNVAAPEPERPLRSTPTRRPKTNAKPRGCFC
jgi:hypothetical protein